jgi:hypothetical protein
MTGYVFLYIFGLHAFPKFYFCCSEWTSCSGLIVVFNFVFISIILCAGTVSLKPMSCMHIILRKHLTAFRCMVLHVRQDEPITPGSVFIGLL